MKELLHFLATAAVAAVLQACAGSPAETYSEKKTVEDGGSGPYKAIMVTEPSLEAHTIFRPEDLSPFGRKNPLPVIVWGNGACVNSPWEHMNFLNEIASHGYLVIATGYIPIDGERRDYGPMSRSEQQIEGAEWALAVSADKSSPYYRKIDTEAIAAAGMSCGGLQTLENSANPLFKALMICNSGLFTDRSIAVPNMPMPWKKSLQEIKVPIMYMLGGEEDIAYENGMDDYSRINHVPAVAANYPVGHGGTYAQEHGGEFSVVALAWLDWQLKGDADAAALFKGDPCPLDGREGWTVQTKNLDAAAPACSPENPLFKDCYTADPAPVVLSDGRLYVYCGHDECFEDRPGYEGKYGFNITEWLCFSTDNLKDWVSHGAVMKPTDFSWGIGEAWASQLVERDGKYYFYTSLQAGEPYNAKCIGVAVSDSPTGPFADAIGRPLVTDEMTDNGERGWWNDIDPTVMIDSDGTPWLCWGNGTCFLVKLKKNMVELDGEIVTLPLDNYVEGPWLYHRDGHYYIVYASMGSNGMETISYAMAPCVEGPWTSMGEVCGSARDSFTIHPGVVEYKGRNWFFYHNSTLSLDGYGPATGRRSVCVHEMTYGADGTIDPVAIPD